MPNKPAIHEQDLLLSGSKGQPVTSSRAGYLPIALRHTPLGALKDIEIFLRVKTEGTPTAGAENDAGFRLYCGAGGEFTSEHRRRLLEHGVKFIYIRMIDQSRFRQQTETSLTDLAADPSVAMSERSAIIYETSVEMMNELLADPAMLSNSPRLEQVSRSITTLVMNDPSSFSHLFVASHHDFYTATHMVNVATWMVPLAYELGHTDPDELNRICQAGILHDMGKMVVPESVLNKQGKLSEEDWAAIRRHPVAGCEYLSQFEHIDPLVLTVTRQHHERLDGTGYPDGLKDADIHPVSRICAVVDSFDAMTAFRPFKQKTLSIAETIAILKNETPSRYDPDVMAAWLRLMARAENDQASGVAVAMPDVPNLASDPSIKDRRRRHQRKTFHCAGRLHMLIRNEHGSAERAGVQIVAHSLSRSGMGFLSKTPIPPGEYVRVYMQARQWLNKPLEGQVVRCRSHNDSWHEMGMQFSTLVGEDAASQSAVAA